MNQRLPSKVASKRPRNTDSTQNRPPYSNPMRAGELAEAAKSIENLPPPMSVEAGMRTQRYTRKAAKAAPTRTRRTQWTLAGGTTRREGAARKDTNTEGGG